MRAFFRRCLGNDGLGALRGITIPDGDAVAPPDLTGNAPVPDILHPVHVHFRPLLGVECDLAFFDGFDRGFRERPHFYEPLARKVRLDDRVATVTVPDGMHVRLDFLEELAFPQGLDDGLSRLETVHPLIISRIFIELGVRMHDVDELKVVALAHVKVVGVMRRGDLDGAGPEFRIDELVADDCDLPVYQRKDERLADQILVTFILFIDGNGGIAEHGLRTCCCHGERSVGIIFKRITDIIEIALHLMMFSLLVGERGVAARAPVDDVFAAVDQALLVKPDKDFPDGATVTVVHRKARARPIAGRPESF